MSSPGRYFDGQSARPHAVTVSFAPDGIHIDDEERGIKLVWSFSALRTLEEPENGRPAMFTHAEQPDARLVVKDAAFFAQVAPYAPIAGEGKAHLSMTWRALVGWAAAAVLVVVIVAWGYPRLASPLAFAVPDSWRVALGAQVVEMMSDGKKTCAEEEGQAALDGLTTRLSAGSAINGPLRVRVLSGGPVNAFAAPGGEVILLEALIREAETPDEVAGVLAHEIGHVVHRHPTAGVIRGLGLAVLVQTMLSGVDAAGVGSTAAQLYDLGYSRDAETEADKTGADILRTARISSSGMVSFFERIQQDSGADIGDGLFKYLSSHPALGARIESLKTTERQFTLPALNDEQWLALQKICGP